MSKIILSDVAAGYNLQKINDNFDKLADVINNDVLFRRNPTGEPNQMVASNLDMDSNRILNLPVPVDPNEPARLQDLKDLAVDKFHASAIDFTPTATITSTDVQSAVEEVDANWRVGDATTLAAAKAYADTAASHATPADGSVTDAKVANPSALYNRISNVINVMDPAYGAKLDGLHDDTAAFIAAVAAAAAKGGACIFVPSGTALISSTIVISSPNIVIRGESKFTTTITVPSGATGFAGYNPNAVFILNANNCGIEDIGMDGNIDNNASQAFGSVANTVSVSGFFVENCYIRNFIYNGIVTNPATGSVSNFRIKDNRLENIGWQAIAAYCSTAGEISGNYISRCGSNGILTGYNSNISNYTVSSSVRISNNYIGRGAPPSKIVGAAAENGFMIVYGAGDTNILVEGNICWDNRNAGEDGIGIGQDGTRYNQGCMVVGNVVGFAGLFGIDATNQSTIQNNVILFSTQFGIKVGTDMGGNCTNCLIDGNLIIQPNNPTAKKPVATNAGIQVYSGVPPGIYSGIKIRNNMVVDSRTGVNRLTQYGLNVVFENNVTHLDNEFSGNDFSQVATAGVLASGTGASNSSGWKWKNNTYPSDVVSVSGATPNVFGCETVTLSQSGPTTVTNMIGGYNGMTLDVQLNDGNTTWKFNSNPNMYGNGATNLTTGGGNWMQFKFYNGAWAGYRTVQ